MMLFDPTILVAYCGLALLLAVTPGPDMIFVIANGLRHGVRGALAASFGGAVGTVLHAFFAAIGVAGLLAALPMAFDLLRVLGALYLMFMGILALRAVNVSQSKDNAIGAVYPTSLKTAFRRGFITNLLNPKIVIFYLALLPHFVDPDRGPVGLQMFVLGCIHNLFGIVVLICVGTLAGRASDILSGSGFKKLMDSAAGLTFLALSAMLVLEPAQERSL